MVSLGSIVIIKDVGSMRLTYFGSGFSGTVTDLKKFLEEKVKQEELKNLPISEEEKNELMYEKCAEEALQEHA